LSAIVVPQFTDETKRRENKVTQGLRDINAAELKSAEAQLASLKLTDAEEYKRATILELELKIAKLQKDIKAANEKLGVVETLPNPPQAPPAGS